jgi:two-component system chemotaxis sensor kinase CheA
VRISVERLDTLLNLVGELVTNRTRLVQIEGLLQAQYGGNNGVGALSELIPQFSHVVNQLQEEVMHARMMPIAHLFNKFPRLVRELARNAGKQVELIINGEATELDRAIIEAIADPLLHLLRNGIDHGIELPGDRLAAGKPAAGTIHISAEALEGQIIITVADDGRGIDPRQVSQAAVERGLLSPEEAIQLSEDEAIELIFRPNLSTAPEVTELSGRGVGMDVVRTNIERLSGSVTITSQLGQGTTFHLTLPLTLALIQTMLVEVRGNLYAIPVTAVNGAIYLAEAKVNRVKGKAALDWQGAVVPLLDLREFFNHPRLAVETSTSLKPTVVLVTWGKLQTGLIVDKIVGQQEIVIKALSPLLCHPPGLSGATILGDGRIALIVDIPGVINSTLQSRR